MSRYTRNTVLLAMVESTYGTDPVPVGATNAMLISKPTLNPLNAQNVPRDVLLGYLGQKEHLVGSSFVECTFDVELDSGGTAGTRPPWGDLMLGCAYAETASAATRVDYTPISTAFQSITMYWYDDGVLHKLQGARGDVSFKLVSGAIPVLSFSFKGLYSQPTAATNATPTLTGFKAPLVVNEANTGDITLGGTHVSSGAPVITGGTPYPSKGIEFMTGNSVDYIPLLGGETVEITQRDASCKFQLDLTPAQEVTAMAAVSAATLTTLGFIHGTVAGHKSLLWLPSMQRISPSLVDENGKRMVSFEGRAVPTSGNDEVRLVLF